MLAQQFASTIPVLTMLAAAGLAHAQATPIGEFRGDVYENFEGFPIGSWATGESRRVLEDTAMLGAGPDGRMTVDRYWGFICILECCELFAYDGVSGGSSAGPNVFEFDEPIERFGAFLGSNIFDADRPDPVAEFYDASGALIDTQPIDLGGSCGRWQFNGWSFATPVANIVLRHGVFGDPWIIMDEVRTTIAETACRADLDGDGELTIFDFLAFQNLFDAGDPAADFDGDGSLTIFDFLAFQNAFDVGCG
jgi:hypothetical protein